MLWLITHSRMSAYDYRTYIAARYACVNLIRNLIDDHDLLQIMDTAYKYTINDPSVSDLDLSLAGCRAAGSLDTVIYSHHVLRRGGKPMTNAPYAVFLKRRAVASIFNVILCHDTTRYVDIILFIYTDTGFSTNMKMCADEIRKVVSWKKLLKSSELSSTT